MRNPLGRALLGVADALLDPTVLFSFDRLGFARHALSFEEGDLDRDLSGKVCLVTGANSGIGKETARALAARGGEVWLLCRSRERGEEAARELRAEQPRGHIEVARVDMSDLSSIRALAEGLGAKQVDVLVHNAGLLPDERGLSPQGLELTFATHVVGPHLLTQLLAPRLTPTSRVVWVSSGGMYTQRLSLEDLDWQKRSWDGVVAYAVTKRMQVIMAREWAQRLEAQGVGVFSMHPGWADTPAVKSSLPTFHRVTRAVLRSPAQGADTVVWLCLAPPERLRSGAFYFDRAERSAYYLPWTREGSSDVQALWSLCENTTRPYLPPAGAV